MDSSEKKLNILCLTYSSNVSRSHTIFSSWIELMLGVTFGFFGIIFAYSQVFELKPDIYKLIALGELSFIVAGIITVMAFVLIYRSRAERQNSIRKINALKTT
jgi:uncharacterized membrane protein